MINEPVNRQACCLPVYFKRRKSLGHELTIKIDKVFKRIQQAILIASCSFVTIGIGTGAILRYLFKKDLYGAEEFITIAAFWMYFIGAVYATHTKKHITAEVFSALCNNKKIVHAVKIISLAATILLSMLFSWWGWQFFHWSLTNGGRSVVWLIPLVYGHTAVFLSFVLMTFYFIVDLKNEIRDLKLHIEDEKSAPGEVKA